MNDPEVLNLATTVPKALAALRALEPRYAAFEKLDDEVARARTFLKNARAEVNSLAADRDRARDDLASSKAELVTVLGALTAGYKQLETIERQLKQKGNV
jgi:hypothetical protein